MLENDRQKLRQRLINSHNSKNDLEKKCGVKLGQVDNSQSTQYNFKFNIIKTTPKNKQRLEILSLARPEYYKNLLEFQEFRGLLLADY